MAEKNIIVQGSKEELNTLSEYERNELKQSFELNSVTISAAQPVRSRIGQRHPQGQVELFDMVISVATGVATRAIYDLLKAAIEKGIRKYSLSVQATEKDQSNTPAPPKD